MSSQVINPHTDQQTFTKFLNKLDGRAAAKSSYQPRTNRELGSPVEKPIPPMCKQWMINSELQKGQNEIEKELDSSVSELDSQVSELDEEANQLQSDIVLIYSIMSFMQSTTST